MAKIRERATFWVTVNLALAMVLVLISNEMRMLHNGPPLAPAAQTSATAPTTTP